MGTCNKLRISLSTRAIFCSSLFLDLWICVDRLRLCKCIVDRLYGYFWIYESVLTLDKLCKCIVDRLYNVNKLFLNLWICDMYFNKYNRSSKAGYEFMIGCDLWICYVLYFWIYESVIGCDFPFYESAIMCISGFMLSKSKLWKM